MDKNLSPHHPVQTRSGRMRQMQKNINFSTQSTSVVSLSSNISKPCGCSINSKPVDIFFTGDVYLNEGFYKNYNNEPFNIFPNKTNINCLVDEDKEIVKPSCDLTISAINFLVLNKEQKTYNIKTYISGGGIFKNTINYVNNEHKLVLYGSSLYMKGTITIKKI
jgi:hypothetical protein